MMNESEFCQESRTERALKKNFEESKAKILKLIVNRETEAVDQTVIDIKEDYERSRLTLRGYVTLDWGLRLTIKNIESTIGDYAKDHSLKRPLNFIMLAEPGSGKSHFVKSLAERLAPLDVRAVTFNMANFGSLDDLVQPLEEIRNLKVLDQLPILFLDEFDRLHHDYSPLLPLLWDGELHLRHTLLKLGKLVVIMAGSSREIKEAMDNAGRFATKRAEFNSGNQESNKLTDLLSRINGGVIEIPSIDEPVPGSRAVDKVCLAVALLQQRFGSSLELVPLSILRFVAQSKFRYGPRSIAHFINLISAKCHHDRQLHQGELALPLSSADLLTNSSLAYHVLDDRGAESIVAAWNKLDRSSGSVRVASSSEEWSERQDRLR